MERLLSSVEDEMGKTHYGVWFLIHNLRTDPKDIKYTSVSFKCYILVL